MGVLTNVAIWLKRVANSGADPFCSSGWPSEFAAVHGRPQPAGTIRRPRFRRASWATPSAAPRTAAPTPRRVLQIWVGKR
eukprot:4192021-Alexandrium_andersonii.AAC.1